MTKIVDLRGDSRIMGPTNPNRAVAGIKKIARHHSATPSGDVFAFQNGWRNQRWGTGGYHEIILRDGSVQLVYRDTVTTNGVGGHNSSVYNICMVGNGSFTPAQEKAFDERARAAMSRFGLRAEDVLGHNEFSGNATSCPGANMDAVRSRLRGAAPTPPKPAQPQLKGANLPDRGSYRFPVNTNIRAAASTSATIVGMYNKGQTVNYDSKVIREGRVWLSWIGASGNRRYSAVV